MTTPQKKYLRAKSEVETSLANARTLRDQWQVAIDSNPTNLTKKEIDYIGKAFKNKLLTVKWDCEDIEELINSNELGSIQGEEREEAKLFIETCRAEISKLMDQLEEAETNAKTFTKHGITLPSQATVVSMLQGPDSRYERLTSNDAEEVQFDKNQVHQATSASAASAAAVFNNALYDHYEQNELSETNTIEFKGLNSAQVFNNLSRPSTNVYMNPAENESILNMLETEYYNPPTLKAAPRLNSALSKILETDRRTLRTVAFLLSFPFIFLFLVVFV